MADFGVSFVPGAQGPTGGAAPASPLQSAIQMLSLRLPRVAGANALAPGALMNGPGSGGIGQAPGQMNLEQLLAQLFGPGGHFAGGQPMAPAGAPPPVPHITPGQGGQPGGPTPIPLPGAPQPQGPRDAGMVDRTMPGNFAGAYRANPWSARQGMDMGGDVSGAVDRLGRFGGMR